MKPEKLCQDIISYCELNKNDDIVRKYARYFKGGAFIAYGLTQELLHSKVTQILHDPGISLGLVTDTGKMQELGTYGYDLQ